MAILIAKWCFFHSPAYFFKSSTTRSPSESNTHTTGATTLSRISKKAREQAICCSDGVLCYYTNLLIVSRHSDSIDFIISSQDCTESISPIVSPRQITPVPSTSPFSKNILQAVVPATSVRTSSNEQPFFLPPGHAWPRCCYTFSLNS